MEGLQPGRIVHYQHTDGPDGVRPAIVVQANEFNAPLLAVFFRPEDSYGSMGLENDRFGVVAWRYGPSYDESGKHGTWHWPPRD